MKKIKSIVLAIALCAVMLFAAAGCVFGVETPDNEGGKDNTATTPEVPDVTPEVPDVTPEVPDVTPEVPDVTPEVPDVTPEVPDVTLTGLALQLDKVKTTYDKIYESSANAGGLFADRGRLKFASASTNDVSAPTIDDVRDAFDKNATKVTDTDYTQLFSSYVSDVFACTQIQQSLIEKCGRESLVNNYTLLYGDIDWTTVDTGGVNVYNCQQSLLKTANIVGADIETGRVYGYETHVSRSRTNVEATTEYYYNGDGDIGITTVNKHYNAASGDFQRLVYNFFDIKAGASLEIHYMYSGDRVTSKQISAYTKTKRISAFDADGERIIYDYASAEIARITDKAAEISAANRLLAAEEDVEIKEELQTCDVTLDFAVLRAMVGTLLDNA